MNEPRVARSGGPGASPETKAWYAGLRRRGQELLAAARMPPGQPLPAVIPAAGRRPDAPEPQAQLPLQPVW